MEQSQRQINVISKCFACDFSQHAVHNDSSEIVFPASGVKIVLTNTWNIKPAWLMVAESKPPNMKHSLMKVR